MLFIDLDYVVNYVDDILIASDTIDEQITLLGFIVNDNGMQTFKIGST